MSFNKKVSELNWILFKDRNPDPTDAPIYVWCPNAKDISERNPIFWYSNDIEKYVGQMHGWTHWISKKEVKNNL
jgi:hypothetical protein